MKAELYHLIIYVPIEAADNVRTALAEAGAGKIGNYDSCSFSVKGTGRFRPNENAKPKIGSRGVIEEVKEERIEVVVPTEKIRDVLKAVKDAHPYEEPAIHVLPMVDYHELID